MATTLTTAYFTAKRKRAETEHVQIGKFDALILAKPEAIVCVNCKYKKGRKERKRECKHALRERCARLVNEFSES